MSKANQLKMLLEAQYPDLYIDLLICQEFLDSRGNPEESVEVLAKQLVEELESQGYEIYEF